MASKVENLPKIVPDQTYLLVVAHNSLTPKNDKLENRCRFDMFVRKKPGLPGFFTRNGPIRTFCFRGDKYTDDEPKMLRNLLSLLQKKFVEWDRVELYDNAKSGEDRMIIKIVDYTIEVNELNLYSLMLERYILPKWLIK
jgi:hypothetical protein